MENQSKAMQFEFVSEEALIDEALDRAPIAVRKTVGTSGTAGTVGCVCGTAGTALSAGTYGSGIDRGD